MCIPAIRTCYYNARKDGSTRTDLSKRFLRVNCNKSVWDRPFVMLTQGAFGFAHLVAHNSKYFFLIFWRKSHDHKIVAYLCIHVPSL